MKWKDKRKEIFWPTPIEPQKWKVHPWASYRGEDFHSMPVCCCSHQAMNKPTAGLWSEDLRSGPRWRRHLFIIEQHRLWMSRNRVIHFLKRNLWAHQTRILKYLLEMFYSARLQRIVCTLSLRSPVFLQSYKRTNTNLYFGRTQIPITKIKILVRNVETWIV